MKSRIGFHPAYMCGKSPCHTYIVHPASMTWIMQIIQSSGLSVPKDLDHKMGMYLVCPMCGEIYHAARFCSDSVSASKATPAAAGRGGVYT